MVARAKHREPLRTCVGCKQARPKQQLVRLVLRDGALVIDRTGAAEGRGAYVCAEGGCLTRGAGRLAKALRARVPAADVRRMAMGLAETGVA